MALLDAGRVVRGHHNRKVHFPRDGAAVVAQQGYRGRATLAGEETKGEIQAVRADGAVRFVEAHTLPRWKDGAVAGPRVLEHLVDCVLQFEGDGYHEHRVLRAVKNRFGSTNEIGVFEMTGQGLVGVPDPSELFGRTVPGEIGAAVACALEGTRPILLEIQALVAPTDLAPRLDFTAPAWTWQALLGIALPLYIVTMASQNIPGTAVLNSFGYRTPWRAVMTVTGLGTVIGDINSRRGQIQAQEERHGDMVVNALVPLSEMFGYVGDLRSKTSGQASYSMEFDSYAEVPSNIADEIIKKVRGE